MTNTRAGRRPLHERVREHLRAEYVTGTRNTLPSLRDLSQKLEINHATISRALRDLETEGVIEIVPRKGIFSTGKVGAAATQASQGGVSVEMVVLYDDTHGQLDVARPIFEGMQDACRAANAQSLNGDGTSNNGAGRPAEMRVTRSVLPVAPNLDVEQFLTQAQAQNTSGVVFLGFGYLNFPASLMESRFIFEVSQQLPVVLAGTPHAQLPLNCVYCDPRPLMREFLDECHAAGLRHYEFFGSGTSQPHQIERHEEFCNFLMRNGLTWKREYLAEEPAEQLAARLRATPALPEVVVATNTSRAIVVALEAQRRGLRLPDDLKLLCFASLSSDAQPLLPYASVLLMDEPQVGAQAWHLLREQMSCSSKTTEEKLDTVPSPVIRRVPARFISRH